MSDATHWFNLQVKPRILETNGVHDDHNDDDGEKMKNDDDIRDDHKDKNNIDDLNAPKS